jgi:uncharacterized protein YjbI with pentapeptide repeats
MDSAITLTSTRKRIEANDANLSGSTFKNVNLAGAEFDDVNLQGSTIHNANLSDLKIKGANLRGASIIHAHLEGMTIDGIAVTDLLAAYRAARKTE